MDPSVGDPHGSPAAAGAAAMVFVADLGSPVVAEEDAHHLGRVLRLRQGDVVVASDGDGGWRLCRYVPAAAGVAGALEVCGPVHLEPPVSDPVVVGFVPVKGERPEWVVQKLTELGVDRIAVLRSERAVVHWQGERAGRALERLGRVAREAAAQSRRPRVPVVEGVWGLSDLDHTGGPGPAALADPGGEPLDEKLRFLAVGPEGGWSPAERHGRRGVDLGPGVLRAETAAVAAATVLCALRDGRLRAP